MPSFRPFSALLALGAALPSLILRGRKTTSTKVLSGISTIHNTVHGGQRAQIDSSAHATLVEAIERPSHCRLVVNAECPLSNQVVPSHSLDTLVRRRNTNDAAFPSSTKLNGNVLTPAELSKLEIKVTTIEASSSSAVVDPLCEATQPLRSSTYHRKLDFLGVWLLTTPSAHRLPLSRRLSTARAHGVAFIEQEEAYELRLDEAEELAGRRTQAGNRDGDVAREKRWQKRIEARMEDYVASVLPPVAVAPSHPKRLPQPCSQLPIQATSKLAARACSTIHRSTAVGQVANDFYHYKAVRTPVSALQPTTKHLDLPSIRRAVYPRRYPSPLSSSSAGEPRLSRRRPSSLLRGEPVSSGTALRIDLLRQKHTQACLEAEAKAEAALRRFREVLARHSKPKAAVNEFDAMILGVLAKNPSRRMVVKTCA
ncbi:hypothetical protein JCM11251_007055 [Rhodosporidiobolus azoricus]